MNTLIEFLQTKNIVKRNKPNIRTISSLSLSKFVDLSTAIEDAIKSDHKPVVTPTFSYSASLPLGGSAAECIFLNCRMDRIQKLARFAVMYADQVFVNSFFCDYTKVKKKDELDRAKQHFHNDIIIVQEIKNLLNKGLIKFYSPEIQVCFSCQAEQFLGDSAGKRFDLSYKKLQNAYLNNMSVECKFDNGMYRFLHSGPSPFFDHKIVYRQFQEPEPIRNSPRIRKQLLSGKSISISKSLVRRLDLHKGKAHHIAQNAIYGLATSSCLNTSFLTENNLHIDFLNELHHAPQIREKNIIAEKYLTSIVPFIEDVALNDILKLRLREEESFIKYRQSLNQALDEFNGSGLRFTKADAKNLYSDVIEPSIVSLDQRLKKAKRDLVKKPFRSFTGVVGAISFGVLTGIIPPDISSIAKTIGLVKFGSDLIKDVMATGDKEDAILNDHFYFLWKVKKKVKK